MDNNRPSKPNLPSAPKPSKLLAPTRLRRTFFLKIEVKTMNNNGGFSEKHSGFKRGIIGEDNE